MYWYVMQQMWTQQWFESYFIGWMLKEKICNYTYKLNFFSIDLLFHTYNWKFINLVHVQEGWYLLRVWDIFIDAKEAPVP